MSLAPRIDRLDKNLLINGNFDFWQRGTSFTPGAQSYTADRWNVTFGTGTNTWARSTDIPTASTSRYSMSMTGAAASGANPRIIQRIESNYIRHLAGKTVTLMGRVKVTDAQSTFPLQITLATPNTEDTFSAETAFVTLANLIAAPVQNQWTEFFYTFTIPVTGVNGLSVTLLRLINAATATTTLFNDLMLLEGTHTSMPATYIRAGRDYTNELLICQRYFQQTNVTLGVEAWQGNTTSGSGYLVRVKFPVTMRVTPTISNTVTAQSGFAGSYNVQSAGTSGYLYQGIATATQAAAFFQFAYTADAEL